MTRFTGIYTYCVTVVDGIVNRKKTAKNIWGGRGPRFNVGPISPAAARIQEKELSRFTQFSILGRVL